MLAKIKGCKYHWLTKVCKDDNLNMQQLKNKYQNKLERNLSFANELHMETEKNINRHIFNNLYFLICSNENILI